MAWSLLAAAVSFGLLVLGDPLSEAVGEAVGTETAVAWVWWAAQWPILVGALYVAIAGIPRGGPAGEPGSRSAVLAGAGVTVAIIVMLTWLWLTAPAVLLGAQVEDEIDRRRGR